MCKRKIINIKSEKGITVTALIVTVIILLILSSVAIYNLADQKDSLLAAATNQKNDMIKEQAKQNIEVAAEKVKLKHVSDSSFTIDDFITELKQNLKVNDANANVVKKEGSGEDMYNATFNGYTFSYYY